MLSQEVIKQLNQVIENCLVKNKFELVELILHSGERGLNLTLLIDKPQGGINLGECIKINRELNLILEENNILPGDYFLEVASPGLDRSLKTAHDFLRCLNKEVVFFLNALVKGKGQWQGVVKEVEGEAVVIDLAGESLALPLEMISRAQLVIATNVRGK